MRVLFVSERFPYPLDTGGNVRTFHLLAGLSSRYEITLITTSLGGISAEHLEAVKPLCADVHVVEVPRNSAVRDTPQFLGSFIGGRPFVLARHYHRALAAKILELSKQEKGVRAVHFNHLDAALYGDLFDPGVLKVLDEHNIVTNQLRSASRAEPIGPRRWALRREARRLPGMEARLCDQMDLCLVCSEPDERALRALGVRKPIRVVPNGVDLDYFHIGGADRVAGDAIVFVGSLDYAPCERAVWYFCTEILPLIRRQRPGTHFLAVGRNPSQRLRDLEASTRGFELTGQVEDVRPHVWSAAVSVVPLLSGSGTRLKILEAMAMGSPIVSTSIGIEGIPASSGEHALIADDPESFAAAVLDLLADRALAARLVASGRKLVKAKFGWQSVHRELLEGYRGLVPRFNG